MMCSVRFALIMIASSIFAMPLLACIHAANVQTMALSPRYVQPAPSARSTQPLVLVYDPVELPDVVQIAMPKGGGAPPCSLLGARGLVTKHLRAGLESLFEQVSVVDDPGKVPAGSIIGKVRFIEIGLALSPSGKTLVGTLEWSLTLTRPEERGPFYSWGERTVGTREGSGSFGYIDPAPEIQGAIEASLRALLKDMEAGGGVSGEPATPPS